MDKLITFQNKEEIHRIAPLDSKQVVYFNETYTLIESGITVFRNGVYQIPDKDFFYLNRKGSKIAANEKFVIGICFYQNGTSFQTLLNEGDYIVFKFSVLSPRVFDYDTITNTISEQYQRQIDGMDNRIAGLRNEFLALSASINTSLGEINTTLAAHASVIADNSTNITSLQDSIATIEGTLETIQSNLSDMSDDIDALQTDLTVLSTTVDSLGSRVSALESYHTSPINEEPSEPEQEP